MEQRLRSGLLLVFVIVLPFSIELIFHTFSELQSV